MGKKKKLEAAAMPFFFFQNPFSSFLASYPRPDSPIGAAPLLAMFASWHRRVMEGKTGLFFFFWISSKADPLFLNGHFFASRFLFFLSLTLSLFSQSSSKKII